MKNLPDCPVETALLFIGNKWQVLILRDLMNGKLRSSELKRSVGNITQKVLTANLRLMEEHGLVSRTVYPEVPPRVEYELTSLGLTLAPILAQLAQWGEQYKRQYGQKKTAL